MNLRKKIMVIDDEPSITHMLKLNLEYDGEFIVREENSGNHAIAAIKEFMPDMILLDVMMPGLDGTEIAARLQGNSTLKHIPIVFLTAAVRKSEVSKSGGTIGGLPYFAKPVDPDEIAAYIRKLHKTP